MAYPPGPIGRRSESIPTQNKELQYKPAERGDFMTANTFMRADEVAEEFDVSKAYAYKIIRQLNDELSAKGFITVAGRVSRQYFSERIYGAERRDD